MRVLLFPFFFSETAAGELENVLLLLLEKKRKKRKEKREEVFDNE